MEKIRKRLTYANVMSSLAMFLVVAGGAAFAATQLPRNSVGTKQLRKGAVKTSKIGAGAVKTNKLAKGSVATSRIRDEAVTTSKIAAGSILTDRIAQDAVTSDKIAAGAILGDKIAQGAVTGNELADDSVTNAKLTAESVNQEKIAASSVGAAQLKDITSVTATSASIANGSSTGVTATCPAGEVVISGGFETANLGAASWEVKRFVRSGNGWRVFGKNVSGGDSTIDAYAYCVGE